MRRTNTAVWLALLASLCCACATNSTTKTIFRAGPVELEHETAPVDPPPLTTIVLETHPSLDGLCMDATVVDTTTNQKVTGAPVLLGGGQNHVPVPPGLGPPYLRVYAWEPAGSPPSSGGGGGPQHVDARPRNRQTFRFVQFVSPPEPEGENIAFYIELEAGAFELEQATQRMEDLVAMYDQILSGTDPGPLPAWVSVAHFTSWRFEAAGPGSGDLVFTSARPGAQVTQFDLDFNGTLAATLATSSVTTVGPWQRVEATVPASWVELPTTSSAAFNDYAIHFETDVADPLPFRGEFETELVQ